MHSYNLFLTMQKWHCCVVAYVSGVSDEDLRGTHSRATSVFHVIQETYSELQSTHDAGLGL